MFEQYKPISEVKHEAEELLATPLASIAMAIKYAAGHQLCQETLRHLDRTYEKLTLLGSELAEKSAKYVFAHAEELGIKIVPHGPKVRYALVKDEKHVFVVVETALEDGKPPAYLWCRPYEKVRKVWKVWEV